MSRIGKKPILIPEGVEVKIDGQTVFVKGPKGELEREIRPEIGIEQKRGKILLFPKIGTLHPSRFGAGLTKRMRAFWGLSRALIANMIEGVNKGYEKKLEIQGIGYRASLEGENLVLEVGFSQPVRVVAPSNIKFSVGKNIITVSGPDKALVGNTAAKIRKIRPPEPYKGKGIRYSGEVVRKKLGKKAVTTA